MARTNWLHQASAGEESGAEAALASSLYEACKEGDLGKAKLLLAAGAEPACRDEQGVTPLMLAAELGAAELVEALLGRLSVAAIANITRFVHVCVDNNCRYAPTAALQRLGRPGMTRTLRATPPGSTACATSRCCTCCWSGAFSRSWH